MKRNETLRTINQDLAKAHQNLQIQIIDLTAEKEAYFKKNVALLFQVNHLKRELITCKEILRKSSSKNKALLLNIKASYDELTENIKQLEDFVVSLPEDDENCNTGSDCENGYVLRQPMPSPTSYRVHPYIPCLSPVLEEKFNPSCYASTSLKKSRSKSKSSSPKPPDNALGQPVSSPTSYRVHPYRLYSSPVQEEKLNPSCYVNTSSKNNHSKSRSDSPKPPDVALGQPVSSPTTFRVHPYRPCLSPVQEEKSNPSCNVSISSKKSRSKSRSDSSKPPEVIDMDIEDDLQESYKTLSATKKCYVLCEDIKNSIVVDGSINHTSPSVCQTSFSRSKEKITVNNLQPNIEPKEKLFACTPSRKTLKSLYQKRSERKMFNGNFEMQNSIPAQESDLISSKSSKARGFFPSLQNEVEKGDRSQNRLFDAPPKHHKYFKDSPLPTFHLLSSTNPFDHAAATKPVKLFTHENVHTTEITAEVCLKSNECLPAEKRKHENSEHRSSKKKRIKRNSIFEVVDIIDVEAIVEKDKQDEKILENKHVKSRSKNKSNEVECIGTKSVKASSCKNSKRSKVKKDKDMEPVEVKPPTMVTRSRSKGTKVDYKLDVSEEDDNEEDGASSRVRSRKASKTKVKETRKKTRTTDKRPTEKEENSQENHNDILPGSSDCLNFYKLSISPIPKQSQNNMSLEPTDQNEMIDENYLSSTLKGLNSHKKPEKKTNYNSLSGVLKSTEKNKRVAKKDKDIIKTLLQLLNGCGEKKDGKPSPHQQPEDGKSSSKHAGTLNNSPDEDINSLVSALSPSIASLINSIESQEKSGSMLQESVRRSK